MTMQPANTAAPAANDTIAASWCFRNDAATLRPLIILMHRCCMRSADKNAGRTDNGTSRQEGGEHGAEQRSEAVLRMAVTRSASPSRATRQPIPARHAPRRGPSDADAPAGNSESAPLIRRGQLREQLLDRTRYKPPRRSASSEAKRTSGTAERR